MPSYRTPGVYIEEIPSGPREIEGLPTGIAAFVDVFADGPLESPVKVSSLSLFEAQFGKGNTRPASHALCDFFANGGREAWVVRVADSGVAALRRGMQALAPEHSFNILCLPCAAELPDADLRAVYAAALELCASRRAFLIIDIPATVNTPDAMLAWLEKHSELRHANAAVYFPRLLAAAAGLRRTVRIASTRAASGAIAGLYARTDAARGVWKAPAGIEADLRGVQFAVSVNDAANGLLNPQGCNALRIIDGRPLCWGARTLNTDPEWKYIPVRRLALFIESSLERGLGWTAFEPNGEALWAKVRRVVENFMAGLFRAGAFVGATPDQTYFVRIDRTTTTEHDIANGRLNLLIGFAPLQPAEFVVLRIVLTAAA